MRFYKGLSVGAAVAVTVGLLSVPADAGAKIKRHKNKTLPATVYSTLPPGAGVVSNCQNICKVDTR